jgi:hypothetical protein
MGYDIQIRRFSEPTPENILEMDCEDLDKISKEVQHLYMTYNHGTIFGEYDIYPRDFNGKKIKDVIKHYLDASYKLFEDNEIDREMLEFYEDGYDVSYKYQDAYLYGKDKTSVYIVVINTINTLYKCHPDDIWISD